ncbi:MAG: hypothetical protein Q7T69_14875 [Rhodoferax sp.]|nr:hypothetical protein [Rhodoferax sp.]
MRLRKVSAEHEAIIFKLGKKYGKGNSFSEQVVSVYLTEVEFNVMAAMPGTVAKKSLTRQSTAGLLCHRQRVNST